MKCLVWAVCLFGLAGLVQLAATPASPQSNIRTTGGRVRTYYIAAEEVEWDYAPLGIDEMNGKPFAGTAAAYTHLWLGTRCFPRASRWRQKAW